MNDANRQARTSREHPDDEITKAANSRSGLMFNTPTQSSACNNEEFVKQTQTSADSSADETAAYHIQDVGLNDVNTTSPDKSAARSPINTAELNQRTAESGTMTAELDLWASIATSRDKSAAELNVSTASLDTSTAALNVSTTSPDTSAAELNIITASPDTCDADLDQKSTSPDTSDAELDESSTSPDTNIEGICLLFFVFFYKYSFR